VALSDWNERQLLALTAGVVAVFLAAMGGLVGWGYLRYDEMSAEHARTQSSIRKNREKANRLEDESAALETVEREAGAVLAKVPESEDGGGMDFVGSIVQAATDSKLTFVKTEPIKEPSGRGAKQSKSTFESFKVRFNLTGGYHEFGQFLNWVETRSDRLIAVKAFKIDGYKGGLYPGKKGLSIQVDLEAFWKKPGK